MHGRREDLREAGLPPQRARTLKADPTRELHTVFPVGDEQVDQWHLLVGAWDRVPEVAA
ncbi:hypothetical protein [Streptomyces mirabilis]|uniref:hypothetical protein n=1 Tax=Streptomyces mirabilis TaxID=68239 RepID=UPI0036942503